MLDDLHPLYTDRAPDWELMSDVNAGERAVKAQGEKYLPPTRGMTENGFGQPATLGQRQYDAYRTRAVFHDIVREAVGGLLGVLHRKPPVVEVPTALQPMIERATLAGETLELLWRRISEAQLLHGRCGLLVDVPDGADAANAIPYIAMYATGSIRNWDVGQQRDGRQVAELVVLDESGWERDALTWRQVTQRRVLSLGAIVQALGVEGVEGFDAGPTDYVVGVARATGPGAEVDIASAKWIVPSIASRRLDRVPFVFVNANDTTPDPDQPPLLGLAHLALALYRGEADYRQALFLQGQDTLVVSGATAEQAKNMKLGAGAIINLQAGGDAKFIGVSSQGLPEMRQALENDKAQASRYAVQMLDTGGQAESGEALRVRVSARTATLATLNLTAAAALRDCLVHAARWMGVSDAEIEKIVVEPNLDFSDATVDTIAISALMDAKVKGAPLSKKSIHAWLRRHEFTDLEYDDELEQMREEETDEAAGRTEEDVDPFGGKKPTPPTPGEGDDEEDDAGEGVPGKAA